MRAESQRLPLAHLCTPNIVDIAFIGFRAQSEISPIERGVLIQGINTMTLLSTKNVCNLSIIVAVVSGANGTLRERD